MLIDTNILIYYLANQSKAVAFIDSYDKPLFISDITVIEILSYPYTTDELPKIVSFLQ